MAKNIQLLIIDPQNDFCDPNKGSLYVKGAETDMERLAKMVRDKKKKIDDIRVTLDSHRLLHIAHPIWWTNANGEEPKPFTQITEQDVDAGVWKARNPAFQKRTVAYVKQLTANKKYPLYIWPPHCLIGSWGYGVYPTLFESLQEWEKQFAAIDFVVKGSNMFTEHYSVVRADVPDPEDPTTLINTDFIQRLQKADLILVAGEALSHCVANSVRDIAAEFGEDQVRKFVILEDASSSVTGLEFLAKDFMKEMIARGVQVAKTDTVLS